MSRSYILEERPAPIAHRATGFTPKQQGLFRPLVEAAWQKHFAAHPACLWASSQPSLALESFRPSVAPDPKTIEKRARRYWYESELLHATGKKTTKACDAKRDFTKAMAHFEALIGESIYWQLKLHGDDARRIAWNIRELCRANEVEEDYMRGMARQMLRLGDDCPLPALEAMEYRDLIIIMGELKRFLRRGGRPGMKQKGDCPF